MAIYRAEYPIHTYEADQSGATSPTALFRFLLDAASSHADSVGYGYRDMQERDSAWVLSRFLFQIERYPKWQEQVAVETWPSGTERLFALRDYLIRDSSGEPMARATSSWIIINAATRAPERPERVASVMDFVTDAHVFERSAAKIPAAESAEAPTVEIARYSDIDLNGHVTSSRYLEWLLDGFSTEFRQEHELRGFEINYLAETLCGDEVKVGCAEELPRGEDPGAGRPRPPDGSRSFLHSIGRSADGVALCRARTRWTPR